MCVNRSSLISFIFVSHTPSSGSESNSSSSSSFLIISATFLYNEDVVSSVSSMSTSILSSNAAVTFPPLILNSALASFKPILNRFWLFRRNVLNCAAYFSVADWKLLLDNSKLFLNWFALFWRDALKIAAWSALNLVTVCLALLMTGLNRFLLAYRDWENYTVRAAWAPSNSIFLAFESKLNVDFRWTRSALDFLIASVISSISVLDLLLYSSWFFFIVAISAL